MFVGGLPSIFSGNPNRPKMFMRGLLNTLSMAANSQANNDGLVKISGDLRSLGNGYSYDVCLANTMLTQDTFRAMSQRNEDSESACLAELYSSI